MTSPLMPTPARLGIILPWQPWNWVTNGRGINLPRWPITSTSMPIGTRGDREMSVVSDPVEHPFVIRVIRIPRDAVVPDWLSPHKVGRQRYSYPTPTQVQIMVVAIARTLFGPILDLRRFRLIWRRSRRPRIRLGSRVDCG